MNASQRRLHDIAKPLLVVETYVVCGDDILLLKRSMDKKLFPGYWIGPGGHIDEGEDAMTAAIRELHEETGIQVTPGNIHLRAIAFHNHRDRGELFTCFIFRANIAEKQQVNPTIEGECRWVPKSDLPRLGSIFPPSAYYFPQVFSDRQDILFTNIVFENAEIVSILSESLGQS